MKKDVIELTYQLSDQIIASDCYQKLKKIEQEIANDETMTILEQRFISAQERLIEVEENGTDEQKSLARKALSSAKYDLDIHPLTLGYNQALKELNAIYSEINLKLFNKFKNQKSCKL